MIDCEGFIVDEKKHWDKKYWKLFHEIQEKIKELADIKKECAKLQDQVQEKKE
jgi:hypothetical protein